MRYISIFVSAVVALGVAGPVSTANAQANTLLRDWSLISFGNASSTSNNQGRAMIGGNLAGAASDYGTRLTPSASFLGTDVLLVGGQTAVGNINLQAGNFRHGGSITGNTNFNGGGVRIADAAAGAVVAQAQALLTADSMFYRTLPSTGAVSLPPQPQGVTFNAVPAGPNGLAVFSVPAGFFASQNVQAIGISLNGAGVVLINVPGTSIDFSGAGNFSGNFTTDAVRTRVLWNFFEATTINLRGKAFEGTILAPLAHLTHEGVISGSVAVASITQRSEIHLPGFSGVIPAPGTAAALALGGLVASRRRRR